jgi:calcineurin-like phosphoesterase family protein
MDIFFTADTHFGHKNILRHCNRPFESIEEHDEALIVQWNALVKPNDWVFHLGDIAFRGQKERTTQTLRRLNGKIHLIIGNHDKDVLKHSSSRFVWTKDVYFLKLDGKQIFLSHYPHRSWPSSARGSWHLFGHCHGNLPPHYLSMDVGVDVWGFYPISYSRVCIEMAYLKARIQEGSQEGAHRTPPEGSLPDEEPHCEDQLPEDDQ